MGKKQEKSLLNEICDKIKDDLTSSINLVVEDEVYNDLIDITDEAYDLGYEEGMEEGEIIQILRQQNPNFDPWSAEGDKARTKLRKQRAKQYRANARKERQEEAAKEKLVSSVQLEAKGADK